MTEGISVRGLGHQILSKELYQEVLIISDMYDLNEYMALDLLCTAQIQLAQHPGLTRGLVAVLLYYDGRKALVTSFRQLVQARKGVSWRLEITEGIVKQVTEYVDQLMNNGVFTRILEILKNMDVNKEIDLLQRNRALGNPKHHRQVLDLYEDIRQQLAEIIYMWSAQTGLPRTPAISLISYLRTLKTEEDSSGGIDNVSLTLIMALLYGLDLSVLNDREDGEAIVQMLPLISEPGLMEALLSELVPKDKWECEGLQAIALLAVGECLATMRLLPHNQSLKIAQHEDIYTDTAIRFNVFDYLNRTVLKNELNYKNKFFYHRIHTLLTDILLLMPNKIKELKVQADEASRTLMAYAQEGLDGPSNLPRHYEQFLYCIARLYSKDSMKLELMLEYWCPSEISQQAYQYRTTPKSVSLFKFVRLAGDMMPPNLFVPYINMLSSLSSCPKSALYCFNLLKQNSAAHITMISWDHFFATFNRYMSNLRQETPPVTDTVYRHKNFHRGITQSELQGLHAVLGLIKTVADNDSFSRIALCEHPIWSPLTVLLGLVSCPVPIPLKAALLSTLASLSKSPETTAQMWNNLEASQILVTIPSTSSYQPRGIQTELDEIESRMEEYQLTRGLLELLDVLTETGIPRTLGAGPRKPGFDPYLTFIINSVFLKFHTRGYKNMEEKWQVAKACLKLFDKFLVQYNPQQSDFPIANQTMEFNPPPGFHIMIQMNTKSQFLDLILDILDESCNTFDLYTKFIGKDHLEECALYCLKILNRALTLQPKFCTLMSSSTCTILLSTLPKLLLNLNPRTSKPDYVLKISKYVGYQSFLPEHAYVAVKILLQVTQQPSIHAQIMQILLSYSEIDIEIRYGFVLCLDADEDWREQSDDDIITTTKETILSLLKQCLAHTAPNFAHYLFGFDVNSDVSKTTFQYPGILGFPRTCIHSLFNILNVGIMKSEKLKPSLKEATYSMLYALCENPRTYGPVLKFIKQNQNFFAHHILAIDTHVTDSNVMTGESVKHSGFMPSEMNQMSWLLKTLAVDQKVCAITNQIFYLKTLMKLLVGFPEIVENKDKEIIDNSELYQSAINGSVLKRVNFLKNLLMKFDSQVEIIPCPTWTYFENSFMEKLITSCETGTPRLINIKRLHVALIEELTGASYMQGPASSQRQLILQEIQKVLAYAIHVNNVRKHEASIIKFMDAWRQLVQIIFLTLPDDLMTLEEQQILLVEFIQIILDKVMESPTHPEVANLISAVLLILMESLRKAHVKSLLRMKVVGPDDIGKVYAQNLIYSDTPTLKVMLQKILRWLLNSDVAAQRLRVNLYGTLLSFLHLITYEPEEKDEPLPETSFYVSRLDNNPEEERGDDRSFIIEAILKLFGDKLIEVMCHDCVGGHDICKMLAMSNVNKFISLKLQVNWVTFMATKGFLKYLIESILNSDNDLKAMLETVPDSLRAIYLYDTKMALIVCMASTRIGAEVLVEQRVLSCFSNMKVFDEYPTVDRLNCNVMEDILPSVSSRYQQILFPVLNLCDALLVSLGIDNRAAVAQIINFLLSHLELIENVLQQGRPNMPAPILQELALITGKFCFNIFFKIFYHFNYLTLPIFRLDLLQR